MTTPNPNPPAAPIPGTVVDENGQMELLSTFYYITGGLVVLMSCLFLAVIVMGMDTLQTSTDSSNTGWLLLCLGAAGIVLGWILACVIMLTGYYINKRRHRRFTMLMGTINLLLFPFGTLLGICTLVMLRRPAIKGLYVLSAKGKPGVGVDRGGE